MNEIKNIFVLIGVAIAAYFLSKKLKLFKSKVDENLSKEISKAETFLNETEYLNPKTYLDSNKGLAFTVSKEIAENWSQQILDSFPENFIGSTDVETIYRVFSETGNKLQISQIAATYNEMFSRDLRNDLVNYLRPKELHFLYFIINSKPNI